MDATFKPGLEIDRINNDGNYEPGNCKWVTREEQRKNQRNRRFCEGVIVAIRATDGVIGRTAWAKFLGCDKFYIGHIRTGRVWQNAPWPKRHVLTANARRKYGATKKHDSASVTDGQEPAA